MKTTFKNISDFKSAIESDADLQNAFKSNPVEAAQNIQQAAPLTGDKWIYRIVVCSLGGSLVLITIGILVLLGFNAFDGTKTVPAILTAIGSGAIGALSGLLAPSPKSTK